MVIMIIHYQKMIMMMMIQYQKILMMMMMMINKIFIMLKSFNISQNEYKNNEEIKMTKGKNYFY